MKRGAIVQKSMIYLSAFLLCSFSLLPILWGISTSFKLEKNVYESPPRWLPSPATIENYLKVIQDERLVTYFKNTIIIAGSATIVTLVISILAAYGFSRFKFRGNKLLLWSIFFTQIFPRVVVIIPFYITLRNLNMLDTYSGLVLVYLMVILPVAVWLLKGFFDKIPYEIEEAAIMDGCTIFGLLWRMIIPMSLPAITAVGMYSFILAWNEFLFALVFTNGSEKQPLAVGLAFFIDENGVQWTELMAASILMSIPAIIVFTLSQKLLIRGLSEGAVKG